LGRDPLFVDAQMLACVRPSFAEVQLVKLGKDAIQHKAVDMVFTPFERHVAKQMPGLATHDLIERALAPKLSRLLAA